MAEPRRADPRAWRDALTPAELERLLARNDWRGALEGALIQHGYLELLRRAGGGAA